MAELIEDGEERDLEGTPEQALGAILKKILSVSRILSIARQDPGTNWTLYPVTCDFAGDHLMIAGRGTRQDVGQQQEPAQDRDLTVDLSGSVQVGVLGGVAPAITLTTPREHWILMFHRGTTQW